MRKPDLIIGGEDDPYLLRWWVIPRNPVFNIYLHCFKRSDDDRALHDHPWPFNISIILKNQYTEHTDRGAFLRRAGQIKIRFGRAKHRVELTHGDCWTLFITGPRLWEWGFYCPQGWRPWYDFVSYKPGVSGARAKVGRGCE